MDQLARDVRVALRRLVATPAFTLFAIASLATGIGVSTAVYSAVRTFFWAPLGIPHPQRLLAIADGRSTILTMSWADAEDVRAQQTVFRAVGATARFAAAVVARDVREIVFGEAVSGGYFGAVGTVPRLGRVLQESDDTAAAQVMVLSEQFWRTRLAADPRVVGQILKVAGRSYEVVGVAGASFHGLQPVLRTAFWIPAHAAPRRAIDLAWSDRRARQFEVWGRLRQDSTAAEAASDVALIANRIEQAFPRDARSPRRWTARSAIAVSSHGDADTVGLLIVLGIVTVLLVACTNLANLTLARGTGRLQETIVRSALGASRSRLVREQVIESALVAIAGGAIGIRVMTLLLGYFSIDLPVGLGATIAFRPQADATVFAAAVAATLLAILVSGLWPAWQSTRADIRGSLGAGPGSTPPKWRLHRTFVAWQVTGSVALFLVAAMCATILGRFEDSDEGARYAGLGMAEIDFAQNGRSDAEARRIVEAVQRDLRTRPGIAAVGASDAFPGGLLLFLGEMAQATPPERPLRRPTDAGRPAAVIAADPQFAGAAGVRLLRGRWFTPDDDEAGGRVAAVTESLARSLYQATDVVGRDMLVYTSANRAAAGLVPLHVTIVGVTADPPASGIIRTPQAVLFEPFAQCAAVRHVFLTARADTSGRAVTELRASIRRVDSDLALSAAGPATVMLAGPLVTLRIIAGLSSALGTLSLVLAMAGLFGVLSHVVARRTREIGIRLAVGASRRQIFRLVLRDGLAPVLEGLALGFAIGIALRVILRASIHTTASPVDGWLLAVLPIPFAAAALAACSLPAARACRVDPNVALRDL